MYDMGFIPVVQGDPILLVHFRTLITQPILGQMGRNFKLKLSIHTHFSDKIFIRISFDKVRKIML